MAEEKNSKSESKEVCYDTLIICSQKGPEGIKEWNKWREENPDEQICLQVAYLSYAYLQGANLQSANLQEANLQSAYLQGADLGEANLQGANLIDANLQEAELYEADLQRANLQAANLEGAEIMSANLQEANLIDANLQSVGLLFTNLQGADLKASNLQGAVLFNANLQGAKLEKANLQGANLIDTELEGANLQTTNMEGADLREAKLQGADLREAKLQGAKFMGAIVNGSTSFLDCEIDEDTDFRDTALENTRIESGTKILLKYNIRRMNWRDWYAKHRALQWPVKLFWSISNYGISTLRIIAWFFGLALFFAAVYSNLAYWWDIQAIGGSGEGFAVEPHLPLWHYCALIILRPIYFSVVTMTTLGFGDMFANAQSIWGHILLTLQVILGYVLLGALVTRLAVLFTSDGPAGSYTPMDKKTKELLAKLKEDKGN